MHGVFVIVLLKLAVKFISKAQFTSDKRSSNVYYSAALNAGRSSREKYVHGLSNARIVTKRKKDLSRFLYHMKDHLA